MESSLSPETYNRPSRATTWGLVLILTILGVGVCFINLGGPKMEPDEAFYALAVDHIRATGDWLTLYPHPPDPYFNKPPLYMWLSAITYDVQVVDCK